MNTTRDHIIQTTCALMEAQGYSATGLNQIIKESGSPKGSLYHYFPGGKEELASAALEQVGEIVLNRIREFMLAHEDAADAIRAFVLNVAYNVEQSGYRAGGPITTVALETASTNPHLRETCERIYAGWQNAIAEKIGAHGVGEAQSSRAAGLIIAALEGGIMLCRVQQRPQPLEDVAHLLGDWIAGQS